MIQPHPYIMGVTTDEAGVVSLDGVPLRRGKHGAGYVFHHFFGRSWLAHVLVCECWHGLRPDGAETRHLNGDKQDNRPANLAWGTKAENAADTLAHGKRPAREKHGMSKLAEAQVIAIRAAKGTQRSIADRFGISREHVRDIRAGKYWRIP